MSTQEHIKEKTNTVDEDEKLSDAGLVDATEDNETPAKRPKVEDIPVGIQQQGMLLDEANSYKMPVHMRQLIDKMMTAETTEDFYLLMLVYAVALEMGFCTEEECLKLDNLLKCSATYEGFNAENVRKITELPVTFQCSHDTYTSYFMNLKFLGYAKYQKEPFISKLTAVYDGIHLVVTLTQPDSFEDVGYSCLLKVGDYLKKDNQKDMQLLNLDVLSCTLRRELFLPLNASYAYWFKVLPFIASFVMNALIFMPVFKNVDQQDLGRLAQVNKDFRDAVYYFRRMDKKSKRMEIFI